MRYLIVCLICCLFWAESFGQKKTGKKLRQAPISLTPISVFQKKILERKVTSIKKDSTITNEEVALFPIRHIICSLYNTRASFVTIADRSVFFESSTVAVLQDYKLSIRGARPDANIVLIDGIRAIEYENAFIPFEEDQSVKVKYINN